MCVGAASVVVIVCFGGLVVPRVLFFVFFGEHKLYVILNISAARFHGSVYEEATSVIIHGPVTQ